MTSGFNQKSLQDRFIYQYLASLNCPRSLTAWILYSSGEHLQLANLSFEPSDYNDVNEGRDALAATKFLSKASFLRTNLDLRKVALDGFFEAEAVCKETNRRIMMSRYSNRDTLSIMLMAQRKICHILGSFTADELADSCNFGPGATTSLPRRDATLPNKYEAKLCISQDAYDFVAPWFNLAYPHWDTIFCINGASKIVTVPKNAKTDRTIAIEPGLNLWFQKGFGSIIRKRLLRYGLDLSTQSVNQARARLGSKTNHLTTVDFSAASDTIAKNLVKELLPSRWFAALDAVRSKYGSVDGQTIIFEKFSSMGNGFTFELETLIFYALALCCTEFLGLDTSGITVFGDDVILPTEAFALYNQVCSDLGFKVNTSKSYSSSYYRESCGSHYWNGAQIKPIFMKEPLNGKLQVVKLANNVRRYAHSRNSFGCDRRLRRCWELLVKPLSGVTRISDGYGDNGLIENIDHPDVKVTVANHGIEGFHVRLWVPVAQMKFYATKGLWLSKLRAIGATSDQDFRPDRQDIGNDLPIPCRTKQTRIRMLIPRWYDLGPWC